jgi:hypothetical protein
MSDESGESEYDLAPLPPQAVQPVAPDRPRVLSYQRATPEAVTPVEGAEPAYKITASERAYYWLRSLGALGIVVCGLLLCWFISLWIGFGIVGLGACLFVFAGPTDSDKRGYHF